MNHTILLNKLSILGIHSFALKWIESYLIEREQYVIISNHKSKTFSVTSGVPQGSHLGPLLFILFMYDIPSCFSSARCLMYADDLKLFYPVKCISDALTLQCDINALYSWCHTNRLFLNINKCKTMKFHRCRSPIIFEY